MNNSLPLVSIAVATYNGSKYLKYQLDSIINQTYKNIEIIISDDHSTDGTISIINEYCSKYNYITYIQNNNGKGFVKNFENAISYCIGIYIALADQDDVWINNKIEILVENIKENALIFSDAYMTDENLIPIPPTLLSNSLSFTRNTNLYFEHFLYKNHVAGCLCMFRRDLIKSFLPFPPSAHFHDWWIALISAKMGQVLYIHKPLIYFRRHGKNFTTIENKMTWTKFAFEELKIALLSKTIKSKKVINDRILTMTFLEGIKSQNIFTIEEKNKINTAIKFFDIYLNSTFRLKLIPIIYQKRNFAYFNFSTMKKIIVAIRDIIL